MPKAPFTITIPPTKLKKPAAPSLSPEEVMEDLPAKRKRKLPTRYQVESEDESYASPELGRKMARISTTDRPRHQRMAESDSALSHAHAHSSGADLDVVNDVHDEEEQGGYLSEHSPQQSATSSKSHAKQAKSKGQPSADAGPARKKARTNKRVIVDSEEEEDYMDTSHDIPEEEPEDDDYFTPDEKPTKSLKGKGKAAPKKATSQKASSKRKAKMEPSETSFSGRAKKPGVQKPQLSHKAEELIDVVGDSSPHEQPANTDQPSPIASKQESPVPAAVPKKPKLPTIKKNKGAGLSALNTPTAVSASAKKLPLEIGVGNQLNHNGIRKTLIDKTDIDLSNKSIYQEIFLKAGSGDGTPRRTKEEERRKELNRMRDEAKAKRAAETLNSFDLQAQFEKISRFEEKLKARHSVAIFTSVLAGKWREQYDKDIQRQKEQQKWDESGYPGKEEGEVH